MRPARGGRFATEREIATLAASTAERRAAAGPRLRQLGAAVDWSSLTALMRNERLLAQLGPRIAAIPGVAPTAEFTEAIDETLAAGRRQATLLQLVSDQLLAALAGRGIRAAGLKGPALAQALYADPGRRQSSDVDVLVPAEDLGTAVEVARGLGYAEASDSLDHRDLPLLHLTLVHERGELPPVEVHWRIHWYESKFARDRLLPPNAALAARWRPAPVDELAALLLYYVRDGFANLRLATDVGAWWDRYGAEAPVADSLEDLVVAYPELGPALGASARKAHDAVGTPRWNVSRRLRRRTRLAVRLSNRPPTYRSPEQLFAQIGLIDGLLTPRRGLPAFVRRQILLPPEVIREHDEKAGRDGRQASSAGYALRVVTRYCWALLSLLGPGRGAAHSPASVDGQAAFTARD